MTVAQGYIAIDVDRCDLCGACVAVCAPLALRIEGKALIYEGEGCTSCGDCIITCPWEALVAAD